MPLKDPEKRKQYNKEYQAKHREKILEYKKNHYVDNKDQYSNWNSWNNKTTEQKRAANARKRLFYNKCKLLTLIAYSQDPPSCRCCGETIIQFLSIGHSFEDGAKHRKELKKLHTNIYEWAVKNNFPKDRGLIVECHQCNLGSRSNHNICPHKELIYIEY